jgi:hypothetical protein
MNVRDERRQPGRRVINRPRAKQIRRALRGLSVYPPGKDRVFPIKKEAPRLAPLASGHYK